MTIGDFLTILSFLGGGFWFVTKLSGKVEAVAVALTAHEERELVILEAATKSVDLLREELAACMKENRAEHVALNEKATSLSREVSVINGKIGNGRPC